MGTGQHRETGIVRYQRSRRSPYQTFASRIIFIDTGRNSRLITEVAATASGGETIAPRGKSRGPYGTAGRCVTHATVTTVVRTNAFAETLPAPVASRAAGKQEREKERIQSRIGRFILRQPRYREVQSKPYNEQTIG